MINDRRGHGEDAIDCDERPRLATRSTRPSPTGCARDETTGACAAARHHQCADSPDHMAAFRAGPDSSPVPDARLKPVRRAGVLKPTEHPTRCGGGCRHRSAASWNRGSAAGRY